MRDYFLDAKLQNSGGRGLIRDMFAGRHLILVDDVVTTGSTLQKCREALQPLAPAKVSALAVSHSFRRAD